jgi:DNA-binding HxlR family transcriptional regulator
LQSNRPYLCFASLSFHNSKLRRYTGPVSKRYEQYCPIAHALGLVGERWSLLVIRELLQGPKRYTDLAASLPGIGTNILAARLKDLELAGVVAKRKLEPPAASTVYELTDYGHQLKPVIRELAVWGLRSIGPPTEGDDLPSGWLYGAIDTVFVPFAPPGSFEFRIAGEVASLVDGAPRRGSIDDPDVVVEAAAVDAFYWLFVERRTDGLTIEGDDELLERLLDAAAAPAPQTSLPA